MTKPLALALVFLVSLLVTVDVGCGSTGSKRFAFDAFAGGPTDDVRTFTNERGWQIGLSRAVVTFGPVYLNVVPPLRTAGARVGLARVAHADNAHLGGGREVGEVLGQVTFDALSPALVKFGVTGTLIEEEVRTAEVWLWPPPDQEPEALKIRTAAVEVAGEATQGSRSVRFRGTLVFDDAWASDALPGERSATPIQELRKVRGIPTSFVPREGGHLEIRFDPRALFRGADFSNLEGNPSEPDGTKLLVQSKSGPFTTDQVMQNVFQGLRATQGTYDVRWLPAGG